MTHDRQAAILINDLDSMIHRIETLQAHPEYTNALTGVMAAKRALRMGRSDINQQALKESFAAHRRAIKEVTDDNTRAGAEPATSQADHDGEALGRTVGSIPATGANPREAFTPEEIALAESIGAPSKCEQRFPNCFGDAASNTTEK